MNAPKKSLGQHWLDDITALQAIAEYAGIQPTDTVLEIGPGLGTLTKYLVARAAQVVAVELDKDLVGMLPARVSADNLTIVQADILSFDLTSLPTGYKAVANIPYYLTSSLLRYLAESSNPPQTMVLLVQKEVAERICSSPGQMSVLAVSVQLYYQVDLGVIVPKELFTPPPKVDSQVVILTRHPKSLFQDLDTQKFFKLVKAGFSERRKKLRSSLSGGLDITKDQADELLAKAGINGDLRAQQLTLGQWHNLYLENHSNSDKHQLFVYGTLNDPAVQLKVIGRHLNSMPDKLANYKKTSIQISGKTYPIAIKSIGDSIEGNLVKGLNTRDLKLLDEYETKTYRRDCLKLSSGQLAWVYVA